jgi:hypothetical protein
MMTVTGPSLRGRVDNPVAWLLLNTLLGFIWPLCLSSNASPGHICHVTHPLCLFSVYRYMHCMFLPSLPAMHTCIHASILSKQHSSLIPSHMHAPQAYLLIIAERHDELSTALSSLCWMESSQLDNKYSRLPCRRQARQGRAAVTTDLPTCSRQPDDNGISHRGGSP